MTEPPTTCAVHPTRPAAFRCDGCQRTLCNDCVQMSHRLILCAHCGEMAVPIATGRPTSSTAFRKTRAQTAHYTLADAFLYPFRGTGAGVFWVYFGLLAVVDVISSVVPFAGCILGIFTFLIALLVPRLLFTIVRTTGDGDNELPEWPEFDAWARVIDALAYGVIILLCIVPTVALVKISGCVMVTTQGAPGGPSCIPVLALGALLGLALWIPSFGAPAVYDSFWLIPRVDLLARALAVAPVEAGLIAGALTLLFVVSYVLRFTLGLVPLVGTVAATFLGIYASFTGAHLVGVYFRRHADELERLYIG